MVNPLEVRDALFQLGLTCDEVAGSLREQGCKGVPKKSCQCPLANYLTGKLGGSFSVAITMVFWENVDENGFSIPMSVSLTGGTEAFRRRFDAGRIPELVLER